MSNSKEVRIIFLNEGTGMGGEKLVFSTNAPAVELKKLEEESNKLYAKGEDVPIWAEVLNQKGYVFEFIDSHAHVNAWNTSSAWAKEKYPSVTEEYTIC